MAEESSLEFVRAAFEGFRQLSANSGESLPVNEPGHDGDSDLLKRHLDCAVINFVHELRAARDLPSFDTIRAPFIEGDPLFRGSKLREKTHVQWCVRNPKHSVVAYFRPRDPEATEA